nr:hypothetical protein [Tanacetum cinerariifolium]
MVYVINKQSKNFEDFVVGHFRSRVRDILMACQAYMEGMQVGCFGVQDEEEGNNKVPCTIEFKNDVATYIKPLVAAFEKIGASEAKEFLYLSDKRLRKSGLRLQKRVLSFVHVPPPRTTLDIADGIYKCLKEWEIEGKIFSISVDNAAYNDKAGLSKISDVIEEVHEAVKYINYSEARRQIFSNVAHQLHIHDRKLMLDVPTRWNSTYDMLSLALNFKDVFLRYAEYEPHFSHLPSDEDWDNVTAACEVLKGYDLSTFHLPIPCLGGIG